MGKTAADHHKSSSRFINASIVEMNIKMKRQPKRFLHTEQYVNSKKTNQLWTCGRDADEVAVLDSNIWGCWGQPAAAAGGYSWCLETKATGGRNPRFHSTPPLLDSSTRAAGK
jgi:hypothetical protein